MELAMDMMMCWWSKEYARTNQQKALLLSLSIMWLTKSQIYVSAKV